MKRLFNCAPRAVFTAIAGLLALAIARPVAAQYFGQNKVQYEKLDFKVLKTAHFDIYFYDEEKDAAEIAGRLAERWYARLSQVLHHDLTGRQPLVLFASHPHFAQTNVVEGQIDESTGGVTEGMQRRIALPLGATLADTDHVIGHELTHAFQYDILGPNTSAPLSFIEGMAEYLSLGPVSVQTAMWLRDAALAGDFPAIKDLDNPRYFPYRFGHAFWAYIAGVYGDDAISEIMAAMVPDPDAHGMGVTPSDAIESVTGKKIADLSAAWKQAVIETYGITETRPKNQKITEFWPAIIAKASGSGRINVGPSLSPDGTKIAFLTERSRLAIEAYVADAETGRILTKLTDMAVDPHFESLQFLESAGTWSPDGKRLAFAAVRNGRPLLAVIDASNGKILEEDKFDTIGEIFQPSWSPDGKSIAFAGHVGGFTDLFVYNLEAKTTARLTQDPFADMEPTWSPDGKSIAFVTDRYTSNLNTLYFGGYRVAIIDAAGGEPHVVETGLHGDQVDPQFAPDGKTFIFISDAVGAPNVYRVATEGGVAEKLTTVNTGVTGITELSSALSVARQVDRWALTDFLNGGYDIHVLPAIAPLQPDEPSAKTMAELPPIDAVHSTVKVLLQNPTTGLPPQTDTPDVTSYKSGMHLVSFSQAAGVGVSSAYGAQLVGGASFLFSDVLGNHLLSVTAQANGGVRDIGAQAFYLNRERRWYWGIEGGVIPLASGIASSGYTVLNGQTVFVQQLDIYRQTNTEVGFVTSYPLSRATRIEFNAAGRRIGFSRQVEQQVYTLNGDLVSDNTSDVAAPQAIRLFDTGAAWIHDTAAFGGVGPVRGQRTRLEVSPAVGDLTLTTLNLDYRQYFMPFQPVTFAVRGLHLGRYGPGAEDSRLTPLYLGYPTLVRGYDIGTFTAGECTPTLNGSCPEYDRLLGSRMVVANVEARAPLVGLFKHNLSYGPIPVEIFGFYDAGLAWYRGQSPAYTGYSGSSNGWATSAGFGARVNVFGYLIAEGNVVKAFQRNRGMQWVFLLRPSW